MMSLSRVTRPSRRHWMASLALLANLIAAGSPVLHAWAHEAGDGHHRSAGTDGARGPGVGGAPREALGHHHDEIHPPALDDDARPVHRPAFVAYLPPLIAQIEPVELQPDPRVVRHPVAPVASRAPPCPDLARAPPPA